MVVLTYLTAGGFYHHVPPRPESPPLNVDATLTNDPASNQQKPGSVFYGPRVPLLVLPPFGRSNRISHDKLELSSLTKFIDWNWLQDSSLKDKATGRTRGSTATSRRTTSGRSSILSSPADAPSAEPSRRN